MDIILSAIVVLLILSIIWFVIEHRRELKEEKEIFDDYRNKQKIVKLRLRKKSK